MCYLLKDIFIALTLLGGQPFALSIKHIQTTELLSRVPMERSLRWPGGFFLPPVRETERLARSGEAISWPKARVTWSRYDDLTIDPEVPIAIAHRPIIFSYMPHCSSTLKW